MTLYCLLGICDVISVERRMERSEHLYTPLHKGQGVWIIDVYICIEREKERLQVIIDFDLWINSRVKSFFLNPYFNVHSKFCP